MLDQWFSKWSLLPPGGSGKSQGGATGYMGVGAAVTFSFVYMLVITVYYR